MTAISTRLGATLRSARRERRWSQERLAEVSGLDRSYVGEIERGAVSPSLATLEKLAKALDLRLSELISRSERTLIPLAAGDHP